MPFKSEAQRRKFGELVGQGKMKQSTFDEFNKATGNTKLPERLSADKSAANFGSAPKPRTINELRQIAKTKLQKV